MNTPERKNRKSQTGVVVSDKMDKTIVVKVETRVAHPLYGRTMLASKSIRHTMKITKPALAIEFKLWKLALCLRTKDGVCRPLWRRLRLSKAD